MKKREITIDINTVRARLLAESGYMARSRSGMGMPDGVTGSILMTDDDKHAIDNWIRSAINETAYTIGQHFGQCSVNYVPSAEGGNATYIVSFIQPHNYPDKGIEQLGDCMSAFIAAAVQQQWSMIVKPDEANIAAVKVQENRTLMKALLTMRTRPTVEQTPDDNVIEL